MSFILDNEFVDVVKAQNVKGIDAQTLSDMQKVLCKSNFGDVIFIPSLLEIMTDLGIKDKLPFKKNGLNFSLLNNKCIRQLNRLGDLLVQRDEKVEEFFKEGIEEVTLKTPKGESQFNVIQSTQFFKILRDNCIKSGMSIYIHLQKFLAISENNQDYLMIKKIEKAVEEVRSNDIYIAVGMKVSLVHYLSETLVSP